MSNDYLLRDLDPDIWRKVKIRAAKDSQPIRTIIIKLLTYYVRHGLPE